MKTLCKCAKRIRTLTCLYERLSIGWHNNTPPAEDTSLYSAYERLNDAIVDCLNEEIKCQASKKE